MMDTSITILTIILSVATVVEAVEGFLSIKKTKSKEITQKLRIKLYRDGILWGWVRTAICLTIMLLFKFPLKDIGLIFPVAFSKSVPLAIGILVYIVSIALFALLVYQIIMYLFSDKYRMELSKVMEKKESIQGFDFMLPTSRTEKNWFSFVAVTAAIGEEIVYRGFLMFLLLQAFPEINIYLVLALATLIFGIAHMYQGLSGMIRTMLIGLLLGALYLISNSLLYGMILHFVIDFSACFLYSEKNKG